MPTKIFPKIAAISADRNLRDCCACACVHVRRARPHRTAAEAVTSLVVTRGEETGLDSAHARMSPPTTARMQKAVVLKAASQRFKAIAFAVAGKLFTNN